MGLGNTSTKGRKRSQRRSNRRNGKELLGAAIQEHEQDVADGIAEATLAAETKRRNQIVNGIDPETGELVYSIARLDELFETIHDVTDAELESLAPHWTRLMGRPGPIDVYTSVALEQGFDPLFEIGYDLPERTLVRT